MRFRKVACLCVLALVLISMLTTSKSEGNDYSKENRAVFERIFSPRKFPKDRWHFAGLPLSGNILGTARLNEKDVPVEDRVKLVNPDRWFDASVSETERQELNKALIDTSSVGPIDLDETTSRNSGVTLSFPGLFQAIGLGANFTSTKGVTMKMHIDKATVRELNFNEFAKAYNDHKFSPAVYDALKQDIIMCFADIQFTGLKINLTVDTTKNAGLDAKLSRQVGNVLGNESGGSLKLDKKGNGTFVLEPAETVTVAYLFRPIPKKGREVDPSGYLLLNPPRGEAPFVNTGDELEKELLRAVGRRTDAGGGGMAQDASGGDMSTQDLELMEEQAGDPRLKRVGLKLDEATKASIEEFFSRQSRGPIVNRPKLALATLDVAKQHIGNSRRDPATRVKQYLALYGLPFRYSNGEYVPFCAAGIGFASCQAYRQLTTGQNANLNDPNIPIIFRDSLTDVKRDMARMHPACKVMMADARANGTLVMPRNPDGTRVIPQKGWLVFYNWDGGTTVPQHVGIVDEGSTASQIHTVEFNTSNRNFSNGGAVLARVRNYNSVIAYINTYKEPNSH